MYDIDLIGVGTSCLVENLRNCVIEVENENKLRVGKGNAEIKTLDGRNR